MRTKPPLQMRQAREVFRRHGYIVKSDRYYPGYFILAKDGRQRQVETEELLIIATQLVRLDRDQEVR